MGLECKPRARVRTTVSHGDNVSSTRVLRSKPTHSGICRRKQLPTGCSHPTSPRIQATAKGAKEHYRVYYDSIICSNLIIIRTVREHLFAILSICLLQLKHEINVKPRMLNWLTLSISTTQVVNVSSSTCLLGI